MQTNVVKKLLWLTFYSLPLIAFAAYGTEPRAQVISPQSTRNFPLPVKVIIYKSQRAELASLSRVPVNPLIKLQSDRLTALARISHER